MSAVKSPVPTASTVSAKAVEENSLWLKLLQENSARSIVPDSTVLVLGGNIFHRKDVVRYICQSTQSDEDNLGELELVNNGFFEVEDSAFDAPVKVNMWGFNDKLLSHIPQVVKSSLENQKLAILILLDGNLDTDAIVSSLQQRLHQTASIVASLTTHLSSEKLKQWKSNHQRYMAATSYLKNGTKFTDISQEDLDVAWQSSDGRFDLSLDTFPLPVIVAVSSVDNNNLNNNNSPNTLLASPGAMPSSSSSSSSSSSNNHNNQNALPAALLLNKELQGKLRLLCLEAGAALCTLPTTSQMRSLSDAWQQQQQRQQQHQQHKHQHPLSWQEQQQQQQQQHWLRKYLLHRLYPAQCPPVGVVRHESATGVVAPTAGDTQLPSNAASMESLTMITAENNTAMYLPSGLDTVTLIEIATRERHSPQVSLRHYLETHPLTTVTPPDSASSTSSNANNNNVVFQEIDNEQDWLNNLHKFLAQVADTSASGVSATSSSSSSGTATASSAAMRRASSAYGSAAALLNAGNSGSNSSNNNNNSSSNLVNPLAGSSSSDKLAALGSDLGSRSGSEKTSSAGVAAAASAGEKRVPTAVTRKPSMIPAGAANQNAKDFFSSLMSDKK